MFQSDDVYIVLVKHLIVNSDFIWKEWKIFEHAQKKLEKLQ